MGWRCGEGVEVEACRRGGGYGGGVWRVEGCSLFSEHTFFKQHFYTTSVAPGAWPPSTYLRNVTVLVMMIVTTIFAWPGHGLG